jgi:hypothetical protein
VFDETAVNGDGYVAMLLKPTASNPTLALSYTSLAIFRPTPANASDLFDSRMYIAFGLATDTHRMPVGGSATYTGVAYGFGTVETNAYSSAPSVTTGYDLDGKLTLTANFSTSELTSTLDLTGKDVQTGALHTFDPFTASGNIQTQTASFGAVGGDFTMGGHFYGPNAEEIGGIFNYFHSDDAGTLTKFDGAFVGKR